MQERRGSWQQAAGSEQKKGRGASHEPRAAQEERGSWQQAGGSERMKCRVPRACFRKLIAER